MENYILSILGCQDLQFLKDLGIPSFAYSGQVLSRAVLQRSPVFCCPVLDFSSLESLSSGLICCWHRWLGGSWLMLGLVMTGRAKK
jgi:hypothetical protein